MFLNFAPDLLTDGRRLLLLCFLSTCLFALLLVFFAAHLLCCSLESLLVLFAAGLKPRAYVPWT